jgi:Tfp pilus assembly protein PilF
LKIDPNSVTAHLNLGNTYLSLNDIDKSIKHFSRAVELDDSFGMAHNNFAVALYHKGDKEKAKLHAYKAKVLGYPVHQDFLKAIEEA